MVLLRFADLTQVIWGKGAYLGLWGTAARQSARINECQDFKPQNRKWSLYMVTSR